MILYLSIHFPHEDNRRLRLDIQDVSAIAASWLARSLQKEEKNVKSVKQGLSSDIL